MHGKSKGYVKIETRRLYKIKSNIKQFTR